MIFIRSPDDNFQLSEKYTRNINLTIMNFIRTNEKINKNIPRRFFLLKCRRWKRTPNFIRYQLKNIKPANTNHHFQTQHNNMIKRFSNQTLNMEINICIDQLKAELKYVSHLLCVLKTNLKEADFIFLNESQLIFNKKSVQYHKNILIKKFKNLNCNDNEHFLKLNENYISNLTNEDIPKNILTILSYGSKFANPINQHNTPVPQILAETEHLLQQCSDFEEINTNRLEITQIINQHITKIQKPNKIKNQLIKAKQETIKFLKENKNILILNSDKSNKTVLMYNNEYKTKMIELLKDTDTYFQINKDPTSVLSKKSSKLLKDLFDRKEISKLEFNNMFVKNPQPPKIYGLPKLHKENIPLRPIVSTISSPGYKIAKYLNNILKHLSQLSSYNIKNSHEFKNFIDTITLRENDELLSFDVVSLFTNVPIEIAIIQVEERYEEFKHLTNIAKQDFLKLLEFAIKDNNYFCYNDVFYKQKKGLAMGNPLSPILADLVLEKLFTESLNQLSIQPTFIKKYVDDVILALPKTVIESTKMIFNLFNTNIEFTLEKEQNCRINFLDMTLTREHLKITTNWYQKSTSSGRILNYHSEHPFSMKQNVAESLIKRVIHISHPKFHKENLKRVTDILKSNNYPIKLINKLFKKTFNLIQSNNNTTISVENTFQNARTIYGSLTYIPNLTNKIQKIIKNQNTVMKLAKKPFNKNNDIFSKLKDKTSIDNRDGVVYEIPCSCKKIYIGQTSQPVKERMRQHKNNIKNKSEYSAVVQHYKNNSHELNFEKIKIKHSENNRQKREFLEQCEIYLNNEKTINKKTDTQNLNFNYRNLLYNYKKIKKIKKTKNKNH